jgi:hypothetical protein
MPRTVFVALAAGSGIYYVDDGDNTLKLLR